MSFEVCPFCGKTFKRLKGHLPHCKAAASSKKTQHDANQTISSSSSLQLGTDMSETTAKRKTSVQAHSVTRGENKRSKKVSTPEPSSPAAPSSKKKKQKLADQIQMAATLSSTPASLISSSPPKAKKKTPHTSNPESIPASRDLPSGSVPVPTTSRNKARTNTSSDNALSTDSEHKGAVKKKVSQQIKATPSLSATKTIPLDSNVNKNSVRPNARGDFWMDGEVEKEDLCGNEMLWKSEGGHQAKITLQDVRTTLGRTKNSHQSSRGSILDQIETTVSSETKSRLGTSPNTAGDQKEVSLVKAVAQSDLLQCSASLQHEEPKPVNGSKSDPPEPVSPGVFPSHLSSVLSQDSHITHTSSMKEGLKMDRHMMGLPSVTPPVNQLAELTPPSFSGARLFPLAPHRLPAKVGPVRAEQGLKMEKLQLDVREPNTAHNGPEGALTQRRIGQVTLRELPAWLACRTPSRPRDVLDTAQRGWQWYYRRYIDVKKGGVGGLGMLLAGYCALSYIWSYPHLKRDRWRKYH